MVVSFALTRRRGGRPSIAAAPVTPGTCGEAIEQAVVERDHLLLLRIRRARQVDRERDEARTVEAGVHARQVEHRPQQQPRADHERDRQGDLADDERSAEAMTAGAGRRALAALLERHRRDVRRQVQERREAEHGAGRERDGEREHQHPRVDREVARAREAVGKRGDQRAESRDGHGQAERGAGCREHAPFGHELREQAPAARAERRPHGEFLVPRFGARQQQVRQIRARDQQDEQHRALQHPHRRPRAADDLRLQRIEAQAMRRRVRRVDALLARRVVHAGDRPLPAGEQRVELGLRGGERLPSGEAADEVQIVTAAIPAVRRIEHERQVHLDALVREVELRRHDADDRAPHAVHLDGLPDEIRPAPERGLPDLVRQDDDLRAVGPRLGHVEGPSRLRVHAERLEEIGRHERRVDLPRVVGRRQVRLARREGADDGKGPRPLLEFQELGRRHPELVEPHRRKRARDVDEALRLRVAERPQEDGVHNREDRRVRADAERQRHDRDEREARRPGEIAQRVAKVAEGGVHVAVRRARPAKCCRGGLYIDDEGRRRQRGRTDQRPSDRPQVTRRGRGNREDEPDAADRQRGPGAHRRCHARARERGQRGDAARGNERGHGAGADAGGACAPRGSPRAR